MPPLKQQVLTVAERLLDPDTVTAFVNEADAASLTHGLAGTALLHARLANIDPIFAEATDRHWTAAATHLKHHPIGFCGIRGGQGGLAASLIVGTPYLPEPDRHHAAAARGAAWLAACARDIADRYHQDPVPTWNVYDAITGLAGIGRVVLVAHHTGHIDVEPGLEAALTTLTAILAPRRASHPGWWLPADHHPTPTSVHPSGAATTGVAHGVAGPLAFLATAHSAGWSVPGQADAIEHATCWLLRWSTDTGRWPPYITGDELDNNQRASTPGRADAWCYGTPGITRSLHLAAHALNKPEWKHEADKALKQLANRAPHEWDTDGPTLCHGHAGVTEATARTCPPLAQTAATAVADAFDPTVAFGFQHNNHGHMQDDPGLLTGATGIALTLAHQTDLPASDSPTRWDSLLNLS